MLICLSSYAQKGMEDVVYLKNGSKIQGAILQLYPDSIVQIKQIGGSVWIFPMKEVSMIAKEAKVKLKETIVATKGYQLSVDAGFLVGSGNSDYKAPLSVHILNSYYITPALGVGIGAGLEFFRMTQAPIYLDVRYSLNRKYYAPYLFVQGGAMFPISNKETNYDGETYKGERGYMINPGIGFLFPLSEKSAFSVSLSYRYHELRSKREVSLTDYTRIEKMDRFNIRFGFILR